MKLTTASKTVTAAGTRERLVALAANVAVRSVTVVAKASNAGVVYLGDSAVASSNAPRLNPEDALTLEAEDGERLNLADLHLDVSISGEGVDFWALE